MALNLVNTIPGKVAEDISPGGPFHLGLRGPVLLSTVNVAVGSTDIRHHQELPEVDKGLYSAEVVFKSVERLQPESGEISVGLSQGNLLFERTDSSQFRKAVYEVRAPTTPTSSILGYVKVKKGAWSLFQPDWCFLPDTAGLYIGLRHGQFNSGCYTFLNGGGKVVVGGPLQAFQTARPNQHLVDLPWGTVPSGEDIEFWLFLNNEGYGPPFDPPYTPSYDVWVSSPTLGMVHVDRGHVSHMGKDPRREQESYATLYFGNGGQAGDIVEIVDWALFQDFTLAVEGGQPRTGHEAVFHADNPVVFSAAEGRHPDALFAGRWFYDGLPRQVSFGFQPGKSSTPQSIVIRKSTGVGHASFGRDEPQLVDRQDGFMVEGFVSAMPSSYDGDALGAGLEVEDGEHAFRLLMLTTDTGRAVGIPHIDATPTRASSYTIVPHTDFTSLKLLRMTFDRRRGRLLVDVDGKRSLDLRVPEDIALPLSTLNEKGRVRFGHLLDLRTGGDFSTSLMNFMSSYLAYEAADGVLPPDAVVAFQPKTVGNHSFSMTEGCVQVEKLPYSAPFTYALYHRSHPMDAWRGAFLEFSARVPYYTDRMGTPLARNTFTGAAAIIHMGSQRLQLGFYEAGQHGKMLGVLPATGTHEDILNQTDLGRKYSFPIDWTTEHVYRVHYLPYERIDIWVDAVVGPPALSIPWLSDDALIEDLDGFATGISFGHVSGEQSSCSLWGSVRYGISTGFDAGVRKLFNGVPDEAQFGGKAQFITQFGDGL